MIGMLIGYLADAAPDTNRINGDLLMKVLGWVTAFVSMVLAGVLVPVLRKRWKEEGVKEEQMRSVTISGQPIEIVNRPGVVTIDLHQSLATRVDRCESDIGQLRRDQNEQYVNLLETGAERENRIKDKMDVVAREWHARLDAQFGPPPRRRAGS